jgi:hypothetical protein
MKDNKSWWNFGILLIVIIIVAIIGIIGCNYIYNTKERLYFAIDKFEIGKTDNITIGQNSDIVFEGVAPKFMSITYANDTFSWQINEKYLQSDSLKYFKVNNENPNAHRISHQNDVISIEYDSTVYTLPYDSIFAKVEKKRNEYFSVRNLLGFKNDKHRDLKSLIYVKRDYLGDFGIVLRNNIDFIQVIILDKYTRLNDSIRYTDSGNVEGREFKLQFFSVAENQAMHTEIDEEQMFVGDINYYVKPTVLTTAWGAGHVMLRPQGNGIEVTFPKAIAFSESISKIDSMIALAGGEIVVKQKQTAFSVQNDIYLPAFSRYLPIEICQIEHYKIQDSIRPSKQDSIHPSKNDSIALKQGKIHIRPFGNDSIALKDDNGFLPEMSKITSDYGDNNKVYFRTRELNSGFYLRAYVPLMAVTILILIGIWLIFGEKILRSTGDKSTLYSQQKAKNGWKYMCILVGCFFVYVCCKLFVATKLSFTYPFFEKVYSVAILSSILQLVLLFICLLIINIRFSTRLKEEGKAKKWQKYFPLLVTTGFLIIITLLFYFFVYSSLNENFTMDIFKSYFTSEVGIINIIDGVKNPRAWTESVGMNDNHTTVYHILSFLILGAYILYLFCFLFFNSKIEKWIQQFSNKNIIWIKIILCLIGLGLCFSFSGNNFSSMLISPLVIIGLALALNEILRFKRKNLILNIILTILIGLFFCALFIVFAALPDHGYITVTLGILAAFFIMFMLVNFNDIWDGNNIDSKKNIATSITLFVLIGLSYGFTLLISGSPTNEVEYGRINRRLSMFVDFNNVHETGYRYNESDAEFMVILSHYMLGDSIKNGKDDIMSEAYPLHASVSTGQSPVVLNDVCFPAAFYAPLCGSTFVFFGFLIALLILVLGFSIGGIKEYEIGDPRYLNNGKFIGYKNGKPKLHLRMRWRILAVCMWVGTSLYIFASYFGFVPFTGRLIPGFGVDSVGEAIESVMLFTFMGAMAWGKYDEK